MTIRRYDPYSIYRDAVAFEAEQAAPKWSIDALTARFLQALSMAKGDPEKTVKLYREKMNGRWRQSTINTIAKSLKEAGLGNDDQARELEARKTVEKVLGLDDGGLMKRMFDVINKAHDTEIASIMREYNQGDTPVQTFREYMKKMVDALKDAGAPGTVVAAAGETADKASSVYEREKAEAMAMSVFAAAFMYCVSKTNDAAGAFKMFRGPDVRRRIKDMILSEVEGEMASDGGAGGKSGGKYESLSPAARWPMRAFYGEQTQAASEDFAAMIDDVIDDFMRRTDNDIVTSVLRYATGPKAADLEGAMREKWGVTQKMSEVVDKLKFVDATTADEGDKVVTMFDAYEAFIRSPQAKRVMPLMYAVMKDAAPKIDEAIEAVAGELGAVPLMKPRGGGAERAAIGAVNRIAGGKNAKNEAKAREAAIAWFVAYPFLMTLASSVAEYENEEPAGEGLTANAEAVMMADFRRFAYGEATAGLAQKVSAIAKIASSTVSRLRFPLGQRYNSVGEVVKTPDNYAKVLDKIMRDNRSMGSEMMQEFVGAGILDEHSVRGFSNIADKGVDLDAFRQNLKAIASRLADTEGMKNVVRKIYAANGVKKTLAARIGSAIGRAAGAAEQAAAETRASVRGGQ